MKSNVLEYKGYHTIIEFDAETSTLRGKIEGICDLVDFQSDSLNEIKSEFESAVEDYLVFCEEVGKEPDKEYKGTFNIRIEPALHRKVALLASKNGESLNNTVEKAIQAYVNNSTTNSQLQQTIKIVAEALVTEQVYNPANPRPLVNTSNIASISDYRDARVKMSYQEMGVK